MWCAAALEECRAAWGEEMEAEVGADFVVEFAVGFHDGCGVGILIVCHCGCGWMDGWVD